MVGLAEHVVALAAAGLLATTPLLEVPGGRVIAICGAVPVSGIALSDFGKAPFQPSHSTKGCHACILDKRKGKGGRRAVLGA
jgi:hypothetical protein